MKRILLALFISSMLILSTISPVFALGNPDAIAFGSQSILRYNAFTNVAVTGDMLFICEPYIHYNVAPTDYPDGSKSFTFQVLNTAGTTVLLSVPVTGYENTIISIYQTAAQVTALGLTTGTAYKFRLSGNPAIFASLTEGVNMRTATLTTGDWINQAVTKGTVNDTLKAFCINMAKDLQTNYGVTTYIETIQGVEFLTAIGGGILLKGCPNLSSFAPNIFKSSQGINSPAAPLTTNELSAKGGMGANPLLDYPMSPTNQLGATTANGITQLGVFLGIDAQWAGFVMLMLGMMLLCFYFYQKTQHPLVPIVMGGFILALGAYLGLMPPAMLFAIVILIVILMAWFFYSRGYI
jgi:hypothetical protein